MRMVLRDALWMVCAGFAIGAPLAFWGKRVAASLVPDLPVAEPSSDCRCRCNNDRGRFDCCLPARAPRHARRSHGGLALRVTAYVTAAKLSLAKIKGAFEINNIRRGCVTCYMDDIQTSRRFGEARERSTGHPFGIPHDCPDSVQSYPDPRSSY